MQALNLTSIDFDLQFESAFLDRTIDYYETIITQGEDQNQNYWNLGIAYLLQQQEVEAQATWFIPFDRSSELESDILTHELSTAIDRVAARKFAENNLDEAWLICQYLREINSAHVDNLFRSILLEVKFGRFTPETLTEFQYIEILTDATEQDIDRELLQNLLESILLFPSILVSTFVRQCLSIVPNYRLDLIISIANATLNLNHRFGGSLFLVDIIEICLEFQPNNIRILNVGSTLNCSLNNYKKAIDIGFHAYNFCENLTDRIIANFSIIRTLLSAGDWLSAKSIVARHYQLLEDFAGSNHENLAVHINQSLIVSSVFFPCVEDRPSYFRPLQNQIAHKYLQYNQTLPSIDNIEPVALPKEAGIIRIGYLASTLKSHSVGWLSRWLMQNHDLKKFQVFTYCINHNPDDPFYQQWFRDRSHVSYCLAPHPDSIAAQIKADKIDILIELDSLTLNTTCKVLAAKPAPVQVSWLGWDATGLPTVDYFIADPYVLPDNAQEYYQEKIWRLPQTYLAVNGFEVGIPTLKRRNLNIPDDAVVYWSGQRGHKRHPETVRLQLRILKSVPNSYFLIKGDTDPTIIQEFFGKIAAEEGVEFDRLRFLGNVADEYTHRANLAIADVVLDTFPYNGATTTLETLWMGIPMVTRVGQQFAARNSYTFMLNAGIEEGIAWNAEEYVEWGIKLGLDRELRLEIRDKLRIGRTTAPVWNAKQFTLDMEEAYCQMWAIYQEKQPEVIADYSHN
ncbi:O-linked N-acetylglucosamine transferase, SPINDLY family protein [Chamaesiphon polymorphus]|uniref:O-linked N-acetylglucosamine transferase, SPINDLY family protein n=1 Tax=Chamaesiphon polymorphus CCALA 037 TaxID=2107692 RepID=A0A2T1GH18_9CYAN|nr:O-linked N-acetylglucosamine transferase, SPINDLY family protein [Chamaesiphon polymorphus]PSB56951.1 O-linked N-acetylglucosamine transferase, SPINDLY family protein [Chamaesiphon polymorphus CCALA 037]